MLCRLKAVISVSCGETSDRNNKVDVRHVGKRDKSLQIESGTPPLSKGYLVEKNEDRKQRKPRGKST